MNATSYTRKKLVDFLLGNASYSPPAMYLALFTADPGQSGSLANEVSGGGYGRLALSGNMSAADPTTGLSYNTTTLVFGPATASWGFVTFLGVCDALSGGDVILPGISATPRLIGVGQSYQVAPQNLKIWLT